MSEKVVVQDVPSFEVIAGLKRTKITDIVAEFHAIDVQMKALKERRSELAEQGAEILTKAKVKSVMVGELRVTRMDGVSTSLSRVKLFELGVKETILEKATVRTPWTSLRVTEKGNGNGDR